MSTAIKPKRWTVQMLKQAVEVNLESHQFFAVILAFVVKPKAPHNDNL